MYNKLNEKIESLINFLDDLYRKSKSSRDKGEFNIEEEFKYVERELRQIQKALILDDNQISEDLKWDEKQHLKFQKRNFILLVAPTIVGVLMLLFGFFKFYDIKTPCLNNSKADTTIHINNNPVIHISDTITYLGAKIPENISLHVSVPYKMSLTDQELRSQLEGTQSNLEKKLKNDSTYISSELIKINDRLIKLEQDTTWLNKRFDQLSLSQKEELEAIKESLLRLGEEIKSNSKGQKIDKFTQATQIGLLALITARLLGI